MKYIYSFKSIFELCHNQYFLEYMRACGLLDSTGLILGLHFYFKS